MEIGTVVDGDCVLSTLGTNNQGKQYWLDEFKAEARKAQKGEPVEFEPHELKILMVKE